MSAISRAALLVAGHADDTVYIEDVFSSYIYTGNNSTQTITTGIDLSTKGGMLWIKDRINTAFHSTFNTLAPHAYNLLPTGDNSSGYGIDSNSVTAFTTTGFTLGADSSGAVNFYTNTNGHIAYSYAQANKFFKIAQVTVSGSNQTVDLSSLGTVGMVTVRRTDAGSNWYTLHRSNTAGKLCYLNTTAAETTDGSITLSGTTLTLVQSSIGNGTFMVYAWAHDTSATGLIQCGTFTTDSLGFGSATLNWEPQLILFRGINLAGEHWWILDSTRGMTVTDSLAQRLYPSSAVAEGTNTGIRPSATGFYSAGDINSNATWIYMAIRRGPMKTPTSGTQVYNAIARSGTNAVASVTGVGFPPDIVMTKTRSGTLDGGVFDRLRGVNMLLKFSNAGGGSNESNEGNALTSFNMDGYTLGADTAANTINFTPTYVNWCFRRYPYVVDEVCYTGTGSAQNITHNLRSIPEMMFVKERTGGPNSGVVYHSGLGNTKWVYMANGNAPDTGSTVWNNTSPTSSVFTVASDTTTNANTYRYVAWLFVTLAGISKVGTYVGNGTSQTINCGFSAGARFVLIKRYDAAGDWFVWDSVRGIVAGNDPHVSLNTTASEVTTDDSIDPDNSGFIVNELTATHINVNTGTYLFLAIA